MLAVLMWVSTALIDFPGKGPPPLAICTAPGCNWRDFVDGGLNEGNCCQQHQIDACRELVYGAKGITVRCFEGACPEPVSITPFYKPTIHHRGTLRCAEHRGPA
jgi:hypothetical protein